MLKSLLLLDLKRTIRNPAGLLYPVGVFLLALSLIPLSLPHSTVVEPSITVGLIWSVLFIVSSLSLANLFRSERMSGFLTQIALTPSGLMHYSMAKWLCAWVIYHGSLLVAVPLLLLFYQYPLEEIMSLLVALALGTLALSLLQIFAASVNVGNRRGSHLLTLLLVLPLATPILILGSQAITNPIGYVGLMGISLVYIPLLLPLTKWVLKQQLALN